MGRSQLTPFVAAASTLASVAGGYWVLNEVDEPGGLGAPSAASAANSHVSMTDADHVDLVFPIVQWLWSNM